MGLKIPIRSMFVAEPGSVLIAFDLSQAETWCVAHLANEPNMKYALKESDIHTITAALLYEPEKSQCRHKFKKLPDETRICLTCGVEVTKVKRYAGKQNNHAQSYRMKPPRLMEVFNKNSDKPPYMTITLKEAVRMAGLWHGYYVLKYWWNEIEQQLISNNRTLVTPYGRKRVFYGHWGDDLLKEATAYVPQSTVGDHALGAVQPELGIEGGLLKVHKLFKRNRDVRIVHTAHDSIVLQVPHGAASDVGAQVYGCMHRPLVINGEEFTIPVDGEIGERWGEMETLKLAV